MNISGKRLFGSGIMLAMLLATFATFAQTPGDTESIGPSVTTSETAIGSDSRDDPAPTEETPPVADATIAATIRQPSSPGVMDELELGRTEITGNQELPKVLYIVPWQKSDPGDLLGRPVNTLLNEVLAPVDREEFIRRVNYYDDLYGEEDP